MNTEYELKLLLNEEEYTQCMSLLSPVSHHTIMQVNHYYDTKDQSFRNRGITVRVREKNNRFYGTIKKHLTANSRSEEYDFDLDVLPEKMIVEDSIVSRVGILKTQRTEFCLSDTLTLALDRNFYLKTIDYELELEFCELFEKEAEGILLFIKKLLKARDVSIPPHKSERFFALYNRKQQGLNLSSREYFK